MYEKKKTQVSILIQKLSSGGYISGCNEHRPIRIEYFRALKTILTILIFTNVMWTWCAQLVIQLKDFHLLI